MKTNKEVNFRVKCIDNSVSWMWQQLGTKLIPLKKNKIYTVINVTKSGEQIGYTLKGIKTLNNSIGWGAHRFIKYIKNIPKEEV